MKAFHSDEEGFCFKKSIQEIAEICDNEYYLSAFVPPIADKARAKRGYTRIKQGIGDLLEIKERSTCEACNNEIDEQVRLQTTGLNEILAGWKGMHVNLEET